MTYNVSISKRIVISAIIFIIGFIFLCIGISSYNKYNHALHLETLDEQMLKKGKYVIGNIDTYIEGITYGSNRYNGVSEIHLTARKTYDYYTVPIKQDSYIVLLISDESVKDQLDAFESGHGEYVYFEGIVIEPPKELNYEWDESTEDFNPENLVESFVIKEAKLKKKNETYLGILLLIVSIFLFFITGGSKDFVTVETDQTDYDLYVNTLNKDDKS